jgi:hypothetical protein
MPEGWNKKQKRWAKRFAGERSPRFISPRQLKRLFPDKITGDGNSAADTQRAYQEWVKFTEKELEKHNQQAVPTLVRTPTGEIMPIDDVRILQIAMEKVGIDFADMDAGDKAATLRVFKKQKDNLKVGEKDTETSIQGQIKKFLDKNTRDCESGLIAPGRWAKVENSLQWITKFCQEQSLTLIEALDQTATSDDFFAWVHSQAKKKEFSIFTARDHFQVWRSFLIYLDERKLIHSPIKLLRKGVYRFNLPKLKYRYWTPEEFRAALARATERTQLYLLLIANCSFYPSDISSMKKSGLNMGAGTLEHQRQKTGDELTEEHYKSASNVPVVKYFLWPETLRLLKKFLSDDKERILLNEDGMPLWKDGIREKKGKTNYFKTNNIASAFKRAMEGVEDPPTMEELRKTGAQFLYESKEHERCVQMFGGWSDRTIWERNYVAPTEEQFKAACVYLRTKFLGK